MPRVRTLNPRTRGIRYERDGGLRCVVSWLLRVSDVMTSQDIGGVGLPGGGAAASAYRRGAGPVTVVAAGVVWVHCTRVGCTLGRWGLRAVRTTLGQWIPTLVEQAYLRRDSRQSRRRVIAPRPAAQMAVRERRGGPVTEAPGSAARTPDSLLRGLVSTVLTLTGSASVFPAGIVGILRFLFDVRRRCACDVSTVDTHTVSCLASWTTSLPRVSARSSVSEVMTLKYLRRIIHGTS